MINIVLSAISFAILKYAFLTLFESSRGTRTSKLEVMSSDR